MKAATVTNQNLKELLVAWLEELAEDAAEKHGIHSTQFVAITHLQANLDDAVLSKLRLAD
jgi:hypothetical protein